MIQVGINENVVITKATKNDQGTLVLGFKQIEEINPLEALNGTSASNTLEQKEKEMLIYPPKVEAYGGGEKTPRQLLDSIAEVKDPLTLILMQYTTSGNIKWDIFKNVGITTDNMYDKLKQQSVLDTVYKNIVDQFIAQMTAFVGEQGKQMRMLFVRQSKAKHYIKLRTKYLDSQPFIEPMSVPVSKLKFSDYEIKQGLNSGEVIQGAAVVSTTEANQAASLFASVE